MVYKKRLEGVKATPELLSLLDESYEKIPSATAIDKNNDEDDDKAPPTSLQDSGVKVTEEAVRTLSPAEAVPLLRDFRESHGGEGPGCIPIPVLRAVAAVLSSPEKRRLLNDALIRPGLVYTRPPSEQELTPEQRKFRQRIERLKIQQEERKYQKLTNNLASTRSAPDDVTTKSMTYAASVGLNMIVAPLSFGCFMYFFAGHLFDWMWGSQQEQQQQQPGGQPPDVARVMTGVVSGVLMLFVEMLLFVIRTHEMDRAMRRKSKIHGRQQAPFGYYTSNTRKTYKDQ
jgi:hypothetical protein